jgi:hypothetical protein
MSKQLLKLGISDVKLKPVPTDFSDFAALTKIRSGGEMKNFELYPYQKILTRLMDEYNNIVVLKSRQMGTTQSVLGKFLHDACLNPASSNVLFMRNGEDASAISRRARQMIESVPEHVKTSGDNVGYLKIRGGGDLYFKNSSAEGTRSLDSVTSLLFDEAAFVHDIQRIYAASSPSSALARDKVTKLIVSTPSAKSGFYWDKLNENNGNLDIESIAEQVAAGTLFTEIPGIHWFVDKAGCCKLILHFKAHPIYSTIPNYLEYRLQQDNTDLETVEREYNLRFVDSAVSVFLPELIRENAVGTWEEPQEDAVYYCGLDCSTMGKDYTVFTVLKFSNGKYSKVHQYRQRQQTSEYHIYRIGEIIKKYKPRKVGVEVTGGVGQLYLEQLTKEHSNIAFQAIRTTADSKPAMIGSLILAMEKHELIYDAKSPLIDEMLSFRRSGTKLEATQGKHDDAIMSTAFALTVSPFNAPKSIFELSVL